MPAPQCLPHHGPVLDEANGYTVIDCAQCGFAHILPFPSDAQLAEIYREEYYSTEKPAYIERHKEDLAWWNLVYNERYDTFEQHLSAGSRRVLDVGAGPGFFLLRGRERGWDTLALEPSRQAAEHIRTLGIPVISEFLNTETAARLGRFDVIHLSEVVEHLPDPAATIELCRTLLNPQGILCITVPNDYNPLQAAFRQSHPRSPWWVVPPHHINYFSSQTMEALVRRCGFEVVHAESTFPLELFLLMDEIYLGNEQVGRSIHRKRMLLEQRLESAGLTGKKRAIYQYLHTLGMGRETTVYARPDALAPCK